MKTRTILLLGLMVTLSIFACEGDVPQPQPDSINKIMPLGASRVEGNRPAFESFRYELWKDLKNNGWTFDFIGTQADHANYPTLAGAVFDTDHEGRSGWTSGQILNGINNWLRQTGSPDIVLFSSPGGNDALNNLPYDQTISNINQIIDLLQANNPDVTIIIEQLAPAYSIFMTGELGTYFTRLQRDVITIAAEQSTQSSRVIAVDMATGFSDALLADLVHYNVAGADFIADRYYTVLTEVLEQ